MVSAFLALAMLPVTYQLNPTDDLWVYPHAGDPGRDAYIRVWGVDGSPFPKKADDLGDYSYSLLQWSSESLPSFDTLVSAKLVLTTTPGVHYTEAQAKKAPLEVRLVPGGFSEKTWKFDDNSKYFPTTLLGTGYPTPIPMGDAEGKITINLSVAELKKAWSAGKPLAVGLTTALDVTINPDVQTLFKLYSKDQPEAPKRPTLILVFGS